MKEANPFQYTEYCLYSYPRNVETYECLTIELELINLRGDIRAQSYEMYGHSTGYSNPVEKYIQVIDKIENKLHRLERKIIPVREKHQELRDNQKDEQQAQQLIIMEKYYFEHIPAIQIQREYEMPRVIFINSRNKLVKSLIPRLLKDK